MSPEEEEKVRKMTREQRRQHFEPLRYQKRISDKAYEYILNLPTTLSQVATPPSLQEAIPTDEGWSVAELARLFGGYVVSSTPTGEQGELVKEDNKKERQILKDMMSG